MANSFIHKRSELRSTAERRAVRPLRKVKRHFLGLILVVLGLVYWHVSHASTTQTKSHAVTTENVLVNKQDLRRLHETLHDRHRKAGVRSDGIEHESIEQRVSEDVGTHAQAQKVPNNKAEDKNNEVEEVDNIGFKETKSNNREFNSFNQGSEEANDRKYQPQDNNEAAANQNPTAANEKQHTRHRNEDQVEPERQPQKPVLLNDGSDDEDGAQVVEWRKGPVNVAAVLDQSNEKTPKLSSPDSAAKKKVIEAESQEHLTLEETAESLPQIVHVTFEDAVEDEVLVGWEDEWINNGTFDAKIWTLKEPKVDFVYLWVNGSEEAFQMTKQPYEENSVLNDPAGEWIGSHGVNRYRDWDELRYAIRSVEEHASGFRNQIQIIVNSVKGTGSGKQVPTWLNEFPATQEVVKVIAQEEFMSRAPVCLPTFNSLTIENQLFDLPSNTDYMFALSDDMLLGRPHAASDIVSPLFGPVMGFKTNQYNTVNPPTEADARRFGEKPFLIYTSWLLNRRFGNRKRKGQSHFGHALSRNVMREAITSFPGPELESACKRFRGEPGFQLYSWFVTFHYLIERHREAMLWSFIMIKSDIDGDGYMSWEERMTLMSALEAGIQNEGKASFRKRNFYHVRQHLERAGLEAPKVNTDVLWTSLDGPASLMNLDCSEFEVNECLAPGFSISMSSQTGKNPSFSTAVIFERVTRQKPQCGDCLLKLILNQVERGLGPVLPDPESQITEREVVVKALMRYKYAIVEPNALFMMITDADQVDSTLTEKFVRSKKQMPGQLCLNDDVTTMEEDELVDIQNAMTEFYQGVFPDKSAFEK